ncbi:MAG: tetratricopeptide repeat protein, partial [Anaerolineae bacterium]
GPAMDGLASTYADMGDLDKAEEYLKKYASVSPGDAEPFESMAQLYFKRGKLDAALVKYKEAIAVKPDFGSDWIIAYIYAMQENYGEVMNWIDQHIARAPSPGLKAEGYHWKGFYHYWLGSYDPALSDFDEAISISEKIGHEGDVALVNSLKAWLYYETGDFKVGQSYLKRCTDVWIKLYPEWEPNNRIYFSYYRGLVDLKEGRADSAEARLAEMKSILSRGWTPWKNEAVYQHDLLKTEILLAKDSTEKAITFYNEEVSSEFPEMTWAFMINHNLFSGDVLARAYKQKGDLDKAITEYERLLTFDPNGQERLLIRPRYHYRLAKLYEQKGWSAKAIKEYEKFLDIWKNADADLPELIDARARLASLLSVK